MAENLIVAPPRIQASRLDNVIGDWFAKLRYNKLMSTDLSHSKSDIAISIAKAAVNAIPVVGGPLGSLMSDFIPTEIDKRRDSLLLELEEEFKRLEEKIDIETIKKPYFISLFLQSFRSAMATEKDEKLNCYKAIILNTAIMQDPNIDEMKIMLRITDNLTPLHIKLLKIFTNPPTYLENNPEIKAKFGNISMGGISALTSITLPDYSPDLIDIASKDLDSMSLTNGLSGRVIMTVNGILSPRLTDFGKKYMNYISLSD